MINIRAPHVTGWLGKIISIEDDAGFNKQRLYPFEHIKGIIRMLPQISKKKIRWRGEALVLTSGYRSYNGRTSDVIVKAGAGAYIYWTGNIYKPKKGYRQSWAMPVDTCCYITEAAHDPSEGENSAFSGSITSSNSELFARLADVRFSKHCTDCGKKKIIIIGENRRVCNNCRR